MTDLPALLARVEAARGPDRELDGRVMFAMFAKPCGERGYLWPEDDASWAFAFRFQKSSKEARKRIDGETIEWEREDGSWILMNSLRVPPLTSSLDATVALIRKCLLHAATINLTINIGAAQHDCSIDLAENEKPGDAVTCRTPELALLAALLRSMIEEEGK